MRIPLILAAATLALAACGSDPTDRAISGAAIGAGAGALVDRPLVGAAVGGIAGAATTADQVDLGQPIWR
jgi:osmotically inducible lipoprotein OsmB